MRKVIMCPLLLGILSLALWACGGPTPDPSGCAPNCTDVALCPSGGCIDAVADPGSEDTDTSGVDTDTSPDPKDPGDQTPDLVEPTDSDPIDEGADFPEQNELPAEEVGESDLGVDANPAVDEGASSVDDAIAPDESTPAVDEGGTADPGTDNVGQPDLPDPSGCESSAECPGFQACSLASICISAEICLTHDDCVDSSCNGAECFGQAQECIDGSYCDSGGLCDTVLHTCVNELPCSADENCVAGYCNAEGTCHDCVGASDCPETRPVCDAGTCIHLGLCTLDGHCSPGEVCQPGGLCGVPLPVSDVFDNTGGNDTPEEAVTVNAGSFPNLTIHPSDPDYYKIDIPAGKSLRVAARGSNSDAHLVGRLIDQETGYILDERENIAHFTVLYAPAQNIVRQARLELTNPYGALGIYELEVRLDSQSPCLDDISDITGNNNTLGKAEFIEDPHTLLIGRSICPEDKDWYELQLETEEELVIWFWREPGSDAPSVILRDDLGTPINSGEVLGDHTVMREDTLSAGTYYISVVPYNDEQTLKYNLQIHRWSKLFCSTDTHEVDDTPWLGLQKPLTGAALTLCVNDVDYFPASTGANEGLEVELAYNNSFAQIYVTVTDLESEELVGEIINPLGPVGDQNLSVAIAAETEARDFLIKTERTLTNFAGQTGYTLSATPIADLCVDDEHEPNNDQQSAAILSAGGPLAQLVYGQMCSTDEADWYALPLGPGQQVTLDLLGNEAALADLTMNLWKEVGGGLVLAGSPVPSAMGLGLNANVVWSEGMGPYAYVEIQSSQTHSYTLFPFISGSSVCGEDLEEPDNTPLTGREFSVGDSLVGNLCTGNPDHVYFSWDSAMSTNPVISGTNSGGVIKIFINIRDADLMTVASPKLQAVGPEASAVVDLIGLDLVDGTYFIELTSLFPVYYNLSW